MLRQRLLLRLGLLVVGFVSGAVVSIALLQNVLARIDQTNALADQSLDDIHQALSATSELESLAMRAASDVGSQDAPIAQSAESAAGALARVAARFSKSLQSGDMPADIARATSIAASLRSDSHTLALTPPELQSRIAALKSAMLTLESSTRLAISHEQSGTSKRLRTLIIALTIAALVMTNVAIIMLVRTANMILRPVENLLEGSRRLANEQFDYRIKNAPEGEFGELAGAYNTLADQLALNEQKKVKALQHLAVTLNHEVNNVINAIELQLQIVNRRASLDSQLCARFADIHANLERIARTIASLRNVRRIVLTDYMPGEPMLDLQRSTAVDDLPIATRTAPPSPAPSHPA